VKAHTWIAHVLIDLGAILAIAAMGLTRVISGDLALAAILAVQGAYVLQFRKLPPGGPGAVLPLIDLIRRSNHG